MRNAELKKIVTEFAKYNTPSGLPAVWRESKFKWTAIAKDYKCFEIYANPSCANAKVLVVEV